MCLNFFFWLLYPRIAVIIHVTVSNFFLWKRSEKREENTKICSPAMLTLTFAMQANRSGSVLSRALLSPYVWIAEKCCFFFLFFYIIYAFFYFYVFTDTRNHFQWKFWLIPSSSCIQDFCCFTGVVWRHGCTFCDPLLTFQSGRLFINTNIASVIQVFAFSSMLARMLLFIFFRFYCLRFFKLRRNSLFHKSCESTAFFFF